MAHDGKTIYYLTGGPIYENGKRLAGKSKTAMGEAKGLEDLHLVTYDIETGECKDRGAIYYVDDGKNHGCWGSEPSSKASAWAWPMPARPGSIMRLKPCATA